MKLKEIPISDLKISRLNMRHGGKAPDVTDILPSIRENGVQQSMLVRKEGKGYGVVAGRRRLFALRIVAKETGKTLKAPCGILEGGDNSAAIEASIIENIARLPATEMEQYEAFGRLKKTGRCVEDIAAYFGNKKNEDSPDYFIKSGSSDFGVAWKETKDGDEPLDYIKVLLGGPMLNKPVNAALFDHDDGADLVWSRPKKA